jgi:hypothetical protein
LATRNLLLHYDNALPSSFFTSQFLHQPDLASNDFYLFPRLGYRHFGTTEVIEIESHAMLNNLTIHGFQDAFRHGRCWERRIRAEGDYFEGIDGR